MPLLELPSLSGGKLALASLKGSVVVLDFWATWCGPCLHEIPRYGEFAKANSGRGVEVIGVVCDSGTPQDIQDFVIEHRITYRKLLGDDSTLEAFGVTEGFPTTFVIDREGVIRAKLLGSLPGKFQQLQQLVDGALAR